MIIHLEAGTCASGIDILDVKPGPERRRNLTQIAREQGRSVEELIAEVEAAIAAFRASRPASRDTPTKPESQP